MKPSSLLGAGLVGLSVYLLLELIFGSTGLVAYQNLVEHRRLAGEELAQVELLQVELRREIDALTSDPETIRAEGRDIGLVAPDEVVVRIEGRIAHIRRSYLPGSLPSPYVPAADRRPLFRTIALMLALVTLFVDLVGVPRSPLAFVRSPRRQAGEWDIEVEESDEAR